MRGRSEPLGERAVREHADEGACQRLGVARLDEQPGDVVLDDFSVYSPDAQARYTHKAKQDANGWTMPELSPLVLTHAGYEPWDYLLDADPADPTGRRWTLRIAFKQWPAPVRR